MKKGEERIMSVFIPVRKILSILFSLFIICLISIILIHIFQWSRQGKKFSILGYQLLIQQTYSIGDAVTVGDVMVMRSQDGYQADDIVSYLDLEGNVVADQISYVDTTQNDFIYYLKNSYTSQKIDTVLGSDIQGKCIFVIPGLGSILLFLSSWMGLFTLFFIVLLLGGGCFVLKCLKQTFKGGESGEERTK